MSSGDLIFTLYPQASATPATSFATLARVQDASSPAIQIPVLAFDGAADEHMDWVEQLPTQYAGTTGLTWGYKFAMDGTDVDLIELEMRILPIVDGDVLTADLGMDLQTQSTRNKTPPAVANEFDVSATATMPKADFGSAVAGDFVMIRITRDISVAVNPDDLLLASVYITET